MQQIAASNTHPRHGTDMEFPAILGRELALTFPKANCGARQVSDWSLVAGRVWAVKSSFPCMNLPCSSEKILLQFVVRVIRHPSFSSPRARLFLAYCDKSGKEKSFNCRCASKFFASAFVSSFSGALIQNRFRADITHSLDIMATKSSNVKSLAH